MRRVRHGLGAAVALGAALAAREAHAQEDARVRGHVRADVLMADRVAAYAGGGVEVDAGLYARLALVGAAGVVGHDDGGAGPSVRGEAVVRFLVDPLRQSRRGMYLAGGVGVRRDADARARGYLLAALGVEGAPRGAWAPAIELGVGGGGRVGVVLRRAHAERR